MTTWRWWLWSGFVAAWTAALVLRVPQVPVPAGDDFEATVRLLIAKAAHVGGYATMTALAGWARPPAAYRGLLMFFLMGHATATELVQAALPHRTGSPFDVGFNNLGVLAGLAGSWKWWTARDGP